MLKVNTQKNIILQANATKLDTLIIGCKFYGHKLLLHTFNFMQNTTA